MTFTALYIPAGPVHPARARDQVLNVSRSVNVVFARERMVHIILPIRNDAFLQNGAHFLIQVTRFCKVPSKMLFFSVFVRLPNYLKTKMYASQ